MISFDTLHFLARVAMSGNVTMISMVSPTPTPLPQQMWWALKSHHTINLYFLSKNYLLLSSSSLIWYHLIILFSFSEPVEISVTVANTIKPSITFSDINIVWEFNTDDGGVISNKILFEKECTEKGNYSLHFLH